jgi:hypothetical protein
MEHRDDRVYRSKRGVVHGLSLGMGDFIFCGGQYRGVRVQCWVQVEASLPSSGLVLVIGERLPHLGGDLWQISESVVSIDAADVQCLAISSRSEQGVSLISTRPVEP